MWWEDTVLYIGRKTVKVKLPSHALGCASNVHCSNVKDAHLDSIMTMVNAGLVE